MAAAELRFKAEVAKLRSRGVRLDDLTPREFFLLADAVRACDNPYDGVNLDAAGMPIRCGDIVLHRLTIGACIWLENYAKRWFWDSGREQTYYYALVYALRHAREKDAFTKMTDEEVARETIVKEAVSLCVTDDELADAVGAAVDSGLPVSQTSKAEDNVSPTDWDEIVRRLEAHSGISRDSWVWQYSEGYALRAYIDIFKMAAMTSPMGRKPVRMRDRLDEAISRLARLECEIVERVERERSRGNGQQ